MIKPFSGELLFHPAGIEYSGNSCTHNCVYCFAKNCQAAKYAEFNNAMTFIRESRKRKTIVAELFNAGYPVCISNKTDPFALTNWKQTVSMVKLLSTNFENGLYFQTKTGVGIEETIEAMRGRRNAIWYITITCCDDEFSKIVEPNAPVTSERIKWAIELNKLGFEVEIGFNPLSSYWMLAERAVEIAKQINDIKPISVMCQPLLLSRKVMSILPPEKKERFLIGDLKEYMKTDRWKFARVVTHLLRQNGIDAHFAFINEPCSSYKRFRKTFGKMMPTNFEFVNWMHENQKTEATFDEFYEVVTHGDSFFEKTIEGKLDSEYIMRVCNQVWVHHPENQKIHTFKDILRIFWNNKEIWLSPQSIDFTATKGVDKNGNVILVNKRGFRDANKDTNDSTAV